MQLDHRGRRDRVVKMGRRWVSTRCNHHVMIILLVSSHVESQLKSQFIFVHCVYALFTLRSDAIAFGGALLKGITNMNEMKGHTFFILIVWKA